jgi:hypothetical protein
MSVQSKSKEKLLVLKDSVSKEATTGLTATITAPAAVGTIPAYDEQGTLLGYIALFDTADLT